MLRIGQLAEAVDVASSKIRYFEKEGVFLSGQRSNNGYREYPHTSIDILKLIIQAQSVGFSVKELKQIFGPLSQGEEALPHDAIEQLVLNKLEQIKVMQEQLAINQATLERILIHSRNRNGTGSCVNNAMQLLE